MRLKSLFAPSMLALALVAGPAVAETAADPVATRIHAAAQELVKDSNPARLEVLKAHLDALGLPYTLQAFEGGNGRTGPMAGTNIVVTLGEGERDLVMTAHYDAVVLRDGSFSHGVVDNAGGTLAAVEAAAILKAEGGLNGHRLIMVLTDQEELGLVGARKWLEQADASRIHGVVNIDVAAYGTTVMYGGNNGDQSRFMNRLTRIQCAEADRDCEFFQNYPPSDDRVFSAAGIPVVSLGVQDAKGARQMWLAFNGGGDSLREGFVPPVFQNIHTHEDRIDKLVAADVASFSGFVADLLQRIAAEPAQ